VKKIIKSKKNPNKFFKNGNIGNLKDREKKAQNCVDDEPED